jgi:hypothetical protein
MHLEKRKPPAGTGGSNYCVVLEADAFEDSPIASAAQRRVAARLAAQFGLSMSVAIVVAVLAGIGGRAP